MVLQHESVESRWRQTWLPTLQSHTVAYLCLLSYKTLNYMRLRVFKPKNTTTGFRASNRSSPSTKTLLVIIAHAKSDTNKMLRSHFFIFIYHLPCCTQHHLHMLSASRSSWISTPKQKLLCSVSIWPCSRSTSFWKIGYVLSRVLDIHNTVITDYQCHVI